MEMRRHGYPYQTEKAFAKWVRRYIRFYNLKHPGKLEEREVMAYITHLAEEQKVMASVQNEALSALLFLYGQVLKQPLQEIKKPLSTDKKEARS